MKLEVLTKLSYVIPEPCVLLLQIEAADLADQHVTQSNLQYDVPVSPSRIEAEDGMGHRIWLEAEHQFSCQYSATVELSRQQPAIESQKAALLPSLRGEFVKYLMPSRYCHPAAFHEFTQSTFGSLSGGKLIQELASWITSEFSYAAGASDAFTTAQETFESRKGVCRDYAHVLIAMSRAVGIPARMVSAYAPGVSPPDFHAVVEVYLENGWYIIDPTGMASPDEIVRIGVGRDAVDVPFLSSFGNIQLKNQSVHTTLA